MTFIVFLNFEFHGHGKWTICAVTLYAVSRKETMFTKDTHTHHITSRTTLCDAMSSNLRHMLIFFVFATVVDAYKDFNLFDTN